MPSIKAQIRKEKGRKTRKKGKIPAILYGPEIENLKLSIEEKDLEKILKEGGEASHITLKVEKKEYPVLIKEIQKDPLTEEILHVDFFQPSMKEKIEVVVPIVFEGKSPAVKAGGVFVKNLSEIEIKGYWKDLPKEVRVDISKLEKIGDKIYVSDLKLPEGVEVLREKDEILAFIEAPEKEEEEEKKEKKEEMKEKEEKLETTTPSQETKKAPSS